MDILSIIGVLVGIAGLGFAIHIDRKRRAERLHRQQRFEWNHIYQGVRQLCKWILKDKFYPDLLIAVPGAGVILSELALIEIDETLPIYMIQQKPIDSKDIFDKSNGMEIKTTKWRYWISDEILLKKEYKVLILDDYTHSGDSLMKIKSHLIENGFAKENVVTAALINVRGIKEVGKAPDYSWFWVDTYDVHMPWGHASKNVRMRIYKAE